MVFGIVFSIRVLLLASKVVSVTRFSLDASLIFILGKSCENAK